MNNYTSALLLVLALFLTAGLISFVAYEIVVNKPPTARQPQPPAYRYPQAPAWHPMPYYSAPQALTWHNPAWYVPPTARIQQAPTHQTHPILQDHPRPVEPQVDQRSFIDVAEFTVDYD